MEARIARIIGTMTRRVYSLHDMSEHERATAAHELMLSVNKWNTKLPVHLGAIRPSMLSGAYQGEATVLKLAHSHAIMYANRIFLLGDTMASHENEVSACVAAAKMALEIAVARINSGGIVEVYWLAEFVTFCAVMVIYVWEIQLRRLGSLERRDDRVKLLGLALKCQNWLADDLRTVYSYSPSQRCASVLEEFRIAAKSQPLHLNSNGLGAEPTVSERRVRQSLGEESAPMTPIPKAKRLGDAGIDVREYVSRLVDPDVDDEWKPVDWLEIDSSVCHELSALPP